VTIGGNELANRTVVGATQITGTTPASTGLGPTDVVVTSGIHGTTTCSGCFSYESNPVLVAIAAGLQHTCGLTNTGAAYCWGFNDSGQLGTGSSTQPSIALPVPVTGGHSFSVLTAGMAHTCGITTDGAAYCWGNNDFGQLGGGDTTSTHPSSVPVAVLRGHTFAGISAGGTHTCGVTTSGAAYCWGNDGAGNLGAGPGAGTGDPSFAESRAPVAVAGGHTFSDVSASGISYPAGHSCGLTTNGTAYCWGGNDWGELGNGSAGESESSNVPVRVPGLSFSSVTAGLAHTCGLGTDGVAYCWGANSRGELGDGTTTHRSTPVAVSGSQSFSTLAPSRSGLHNCGLINSGAAFCWGWNSHGQLGTGGEEDPSAQSTTPVAVSGGLSFTSLALGTYHTCGMTNEGAYCWGRNDFGQLGNGSRTSSTVPVKVAGLP
jgi:alpha-tubulin suppressor-like RCC1 family protein